MGNAYTTAWLLFTSFLPVTWMIVLYSRVVCTLWVNGKSQKGPQQVRTCHAFIKTPSTRIRIFWREIFLSTSTRSVFESLGTLRSNDADDNENVKKNNWFNEQNNNFARASHFLYISFPFLHDFDVKMPNFAFYVGRKQATTKFYFSSWAWIWSFEIQLQEGSPIIDKVSGKE